MQNTTQKKAQRRLAEVCFIVLMRSRQIGSVVQLVLALALTSAANGTFYAGNVSGKVLVDFKIVKPKNSNAKRL